jgi:hypothetical protein
MTALITCLTALAGVLVKLNLWPFKRTTKRLSDPKKHSLFGKCDYWIQVVIPSIKVAYPRKRRLAIKYLTLYITVFRDGLRDYFKDGAVCALPGEMIRQHQELFLNMKRTVDLRAREMNIPVIFLDKVNERNRQWDSVMYNDIEDMCNSEFYHDCEDKLAAILDSYTHFLRRLTMDAERTMKELNGELDAVLAEEK